MISAFDYSIQHKNHTTHNQQTYRIKSGSTLIDQLLIDKQLPSIIELSGMIHSIEYLWVD